MTHRQRFVMAFVGLCLGSGWAQDDLAQVEQVARIYVEPQGRLTAADDAVVVHPYGQWRGGGRIARVNGVTRDDAVMEMLVGHDVRWTPREGHRLHVEAAAAWAGTAQGGMLHPQSRAACGWRFQGEAWTHAITGQVQDDRPFRPESFEQPRQIRWMGSSEHRWSGAVVDVGTRLTVVRELQRDRSRVFRRGQPDHDEVASESSATRWWGSRWQTGLVVQVAARSYHSASAPHDDVVRYGADVTARMDPTERVSCRGQVGLMQWHVDHAGSDEASILRPRGMGSVRWTYREAAWVSVGGSWDQVPGARRPLADRLQVEQRWWHPLPGPWVVQEEQELGRRRESLPGEEQWRWSGLLRVLHLSGPGLRTMGTLQTERLIGPDRRSVTSWTATMGILVFL